MTEHDFRAGPRTYLATQDLVCLRCGENRTVSHKKAARYKAYDPETDWSEKLENALHDEWSMDCDPSRWIK